MPKWHIRKYKTSQNGIFMLNKICHFSYNKGMTLKEYRKKWNITQLEASKIVGIPLRTYSRYENSNDPNSFKYQKAFDALKEYTKIDEDNGILTFDDIKEGINEICMNKDIEGVYLFGSYAKKKANQKSDVDLLVETDITGLAFYGLVEEIRGKLKKRVDVIRLKDMNNVDILKEIIKDGIKIYG